MIHLPVVAEVFAEDSAMYTVSEPLAALLLEKFPCISLEMDYRRITSGESVDIDPHEVVGDRIILQIANVGNESAAERRGETVLLIDPKKGILHPLLLEKLARYLEVPAHDRALVEVQALLAKDIEAWMEREPGAAKELGLRLDKSTGFIELNCRNYAHS